MAANQERDDKMLSVSDTCPKPTVLSKERDPEPEEQVSEPTTHVPEIPKTGEHDRLPHRDAIRTPTRKRQFLQQIILWGGEKKRW